MTPELTVGALSSAAPSVASESGATPTELPAQTPNHETVAISADATATEHAGRASGDDAATAGTAATGHAVVAVVGLGYVGLPTAIALRNAGCWIVGIDISPARLEAIRDGSAELLASEREDLRAHLVGEHFLLTDRIEALDAADLVLICVPTPIDERRQPAPEILRRACAEVVAHARPGQTLVLTSTTYVGTTRELLVEPLAERGMVVGEDVFVAFAPERIDPGVPDHEQLLTPRVIGAVSETCFRRAAQLLQHTCKSLYRVSSPEAAEMVKLYENTFRAVNIALAFEMAEACRAHGLEPIEVTDGAATKPYGFLAHYPSAGVGGHCIAVDPHYLLHPLRERGRPATVAEEALRKLAGRPRHVAARAHEVLVELGKRLSDARVLVVGVSYKPSVADTREAPALELIARLRTEGAHVDYHDPLVAQIELDGESLAGVDPDPRRGSIEDPAVPAPFGVCPEPPIAGGRRCIDPRSGGGLGPEDYDLAIIATMHPDHDYGWLHRCPAVLDCTYRNPIGRLRFLL